jgi:anti-sigma regulatory factor (Ser/Thr protein kinase)
LRADPVSALVARAFVGQIADELHYNSAERAELRLAVSEAVANAVEHGAPCENGVSVSAYVDSGSLTTEVYDCGDFKEARQRTKDMEVRGRDLQFAAVNHLEIDIVPGRTVIRLARRLSR